MKVLMIAFLAVAIPSSALGDEPLHTFPASGIELHATDDVEDVEVEGTFIRFHVADSTVFATAMVFKDTQNDYPLVREFSDQFMSSTYSGPGNRVFSEIQVETDFANRMVTGREYLIDTERDECDMLLSHAVGDRSYIFFNLTDLRTGRRCVDVGRDLQSAARKIAASIVINGT